MFAVSSTSAPAQSQGAAVYLTFGEGTGTTAADASGNGHTAARSARWRSTRPSRSPGTITLTRIAPTFDLALAPYSISVLEIQPRADRCDR